MKKGLVTIIIPTKNSSALLSACLRKIKKQNYKNYEVIIVDGKSDDRGTTKALAKKYRCVFLSHAPRVKKGLFDATKKRNFAAKRARGEFIYHMDADMEVTPHVIGEAVRLCANGADAVILTEDSFGVGIWASAKNLERRFFWGDDTVESPRFFRTSVWKALKGYDETIAGGGDDRDIYQKTLLSGYRVARTKHLVMHNEGILHLTYLWKKQFMYKREALKYVRKRPFISLISYFPIRKAHFIHWRMFAERPKDTILFIIMKTVETAAGMCGILYSFFD